MSVAAYDQLGVRRFEFAPIWDFIVLLLYRMRRVDCRTCGVRVEEVPWATGKHKLTKAYMLFLAHWARKRNRRVLPQLVGQSAPGGRVR
jgi:transposase